MKKLNGLNKSNKKRNFIVVSAFLFVCLLVVGVSYAVYQKTDEVLFINAKVGEFETSNSDIELAIMVDGEDVDKPPKKDDGYYNVAVECDHADGIWDKEKWGATITNITSNRVKCNVNFESYKLVIKDVELGDYISMIPTSTSYTVPTSLTGYSSNQTINPGELNLWRVIKKNDDGTVEVVSEYVSSESIYFYGQVGFLNYIGTLNTIASQYTNSKYVSKTRHTMYSNQIEKCTLLAACPTDNGSLDLNLINTAIGTIIGKNLNGVASTYCRASREKGNSEYFLRIIDSFGNYNNFSMTQVGSCAIRPILTLKNVGIINGDGKSESTAYQLSD